MSVPNVATDKSINTSLDPLMTRGTAYMPNIPRASCKLLCNLSNVVCRPISVSFLNGQRSLFLTRLALSCRESGSLVWAHFFIVISSLIKAFWHVRNASCNCSDATLLSRCRFSFTLSSASRIPSRHSRRVMTESMSS